MKVAIIGSAGAMGSFFMQYFTSKGNEVAGSDVVGAGERSARLTSSNTEATKDADAVLIATPLDTTVTVCRQVIPRLRAGAVLIEISSVKDKALAQVRKAAERRGASLLYIHPLFGPSLSTSKGMKIAVVRQGRDKSMDLARRLFPDVMLFPMSAEVHDMLMAILLSLTHVTNIAYAKVVSDIIPPNEFKKLATPTSLLQLTLAESVLAQDPSLYAPIQTKNRFSAEVIRNMVVELLKMNGMIERGDTKKFQMHFVELTRLYSVDPSTVKKVYRAVDAITG